MVLTVLLRRGLQHFDDLGSEDSSPGIGLPNAFLSKLTDHAKELERQFETIRKQLFDRAREGEASLLRWSARAQLEKYAEEGKAKTVVK